MDARRAPLALVLLLALGSLGANYRTPNFLVTAGSQQFAKQVGDYAERYRRDLAIEWLGHELPRWMEPCPIRVDAAPGLGAGGATSFMFDRGRPFGWTMNIQGSQQRILDSVLPHEVTHTIFATHFGGPLPRWADEGACTVVEHPSERAKQQQFLIDFLSTKPSRGIAFNRMFAMTEYPRDILPLYSQGHSVAQYLIHQGGKRKFIDFVGRGMQTRSWDAAVMEFYGYRDLSDLQLTWVDWVRAGSPDDVTPRLAARDQPAPALAGTNEQPQRSLPTAAAALSGSSRQAAMGQAPFQRSARSDQPPASDSWYARQRGRTAGNGLPPSAAGAAARPNGQPPVIQRNSRARIPLSDRLHDQPAPRSPVYYDAPTGAATVWR